MMLDLRKPDFKYDGVLPANSMWIRLGDKTLHRVSDEASIMRSTGGFRFEDEKGGRPGLEGQGRQRGGHSGSGKGRPAAVCHDQRHPVQFGCIGLHGAADRSWPAIPMF